MPAFTAQSPAWLPSQHRLTRAIDDATSTATPPKAAPANIKAQRTSKKAAFLNFVLVASAPKDVPAKPPTARTGTARKASPWVLPPSSLDRLSDPCLDGAKASPRWDGWSFKRQGRVAEASAKPVPDEAPADAHAESGAESDAESDAERIAPAAPIHVRKEMWSKFISSFVRGPGTGGRSKPASDDPAADTASVGSDSEQEDAYTDAEEHDDDGVNGDDDDDMFVMEQDAVDVGRNRRNRGRSSASELATLCKYSMVRTGSHLSTLQGLHKIRLPTAVFA